MARLYPGPHNWKVPCPDCGYCEMCDGHEYYHEGYINAAKRVYSEEQEVDRMVNEGCRNDHLERC